MTANLQNAVCRAFRILVLTVAFVPAVALAREGRPQGNGFYLAGLGGPVIGFANGIKNGAGRKLADDNALNGIGGFGMAAGYTWAREGLPLRTELQFVNRTEISYNVSPLFSGSAANDAIASDIQNVTTLLKGYYHFDVGSPKWSPFVSAGLGWSRTAVSGQYTPAGATPIKLDQVTNGLAWTAGIGASLYLGNHIVNDIELSYVDLGEVDFGLPSSINLHTNTLGAAQLTFALRYNF